MRIALFVRSAGAIALIAAAAAVAAAEDHSQHHHAVAQPAYSRSDAAVRLPTVRLRRADGSGVEFPGEIDDGRPVILNFIYTSCTAICPPMTQVFAEFQRRLGAERDKVRMVSLSIDPEHDTPARLAAYAQQYGAGPQWSFYTGSSAASVAVQKGFGAWRGDKMNHTPATWLRAAPGKPWVLLDGFVRPEDLLREYRQIVAAGKTASATP